MSGGGGNQGETKYNWNPFMENMWAGGVDGNIGLLNRAVNGTLNKPYEQYTGQRIADFNTDQTAGFDRIRNVATNGTESANAADSQVRDTLQGRYLTGAESNPWANVSNPFGDSQTNVMGMDPNAQRVSAGKNQYSGLDNPYFSGVTKQGMGDITDAYRQGTEANTTKMMNMAGIFGGGAHQKATDINEKNLGKSLSNYAEQMGNTQYDRSAGLEESGLGRDLGAQQFNSGQQAQGYGDWASRAFQGSANDIGRANQNWENKRNTGSQSWDAERGRMVSTMPQGWAAEQRALGTGNALLGIGGQQQGQTQQGLDLNAQDWANQQNWERSNIDWMSGLLGRAQGGIGGASTTSAPGYTMNPVAGMMGGAAFGRGMGWF